MKLQILTLFSILELISSASAGQEILPKTGALKLRTDLSDTNGPIHLQLYKSNFIDDRIPISIKSAANVVKHTNIKDIGITPVVGNIEGEQDSFVHGSIHNDEFQGFIHTNQESTFFKTHKIIFPSAYSSGNGEDGNYVPTAKTDIYERHLDTYKLPGVSRTLKQIKMLAVRAPRHNRYKREESLDDKYLNSNHDGSVDWTKEAKVNGKRFGPNRTCKLKVIADHTFFEVYSNRDVKKAVVTMLWTIQEADRLFRTFDLDLNGQSDNVGFSIGKFVVFQDEYVNDYPIHEPYRLGVEGAQDYLEDFTRFDSEEYCVTYGFSSIYFEDAIGMSWVSEVCDDNWNVGFLTYNYSGKEMPKAIAISTFVHEIGHLFGAWHDPKKEGPECSPGNNDNYIMYPRAQIAEWGTNKVKFSPCSKNAVYENLIIQGKNKCFDPETQPMKQTHKNVDLDVVSCSEKNTAQCDPMGRDSQCCEEDCTFKPHDAQCSTSFLSWGHCDDGNCRSSFMGLNSAARKTHIFGKDSSSTISPATFDSGASYVKVCVGLMIFAAIGVLL